MKKYLLAAAVGILATTSAFAQLDKAASEATSAADHKIEQKQAEGEAQKSGPVGKAVNNTKAEYHKNMAEHNANEVKEELGVKKDKGVVIRRDSSVTPAATTPKR